MSTLPRRRRGNGTDLKKKSCIQLPQVDDKRCYVAKIKLNKNQQLSSTDLGARYVCVHVSDGVLKSRDSTLPTSVCLVKAMVFPPGLPRWK